MRRTSDEAAYNEKLRQQTAPGRYYYDSPTPGNPTAFPDDPWIRPQVTGAALSTCYQPIDVEHNLRGVGLPLGRAPMGATSNTGASHHHFDTNPVRIGSNTWDVGGGCVGGTGGIWGVVGGVMTSGWTIPQTPVPFLQTKDSRTELPPIALKGLAPNRFDPVLFHNPMEEAFAPFDREVNTRMVSKDQWRIPGSSVRRLAISRASVGNPEGNVPPVYGTSIVPTEDLVECQKSKEAAKRYITKIFYTEPAPPCHSAQGSTPSSEVFAPPPMNSSHRQATRLPTGFTNHSRFSTPSLGSSTSVSRNEGFSGQRASSSTPTPTGQSQPLTLVGGGSVESKCGGISLDEYYQKVVYTEPSPVCN